MLRWASVWCSRSPPTAAGTARSPPRQKAKNGAARRRPGAPGRPAALPIRSAHPRPQPTHASSSYASPRLEPVRCRASTPGNTTRRQAQHRQWLRDLHETQHVTTVLVTHDQEEAMEVADRLAVINHGRLEQVGSPTELYDRPANEFVLTFIGPATGLGGRWVRSHDLAVHQAGDAPSPPGARQGTVTRIAHLGFEVKVDIE